LSQEEYRLRGEIRALLNDKEYNIDDIRKKFKDKYPAGSHVFNLDQGKALTIDRSSKKDLISEYIQRIKGANKLKNEVKWTKDEIQRRKVPVQVQLPAQVEANRNN